MLIFKSFLSTLPASIRVCTLYGLIMRNARGEAVVSDVVKSVLFEHWKCALSFPKSVLLALQAQTQTQGKGWSCYGGQRVLSPKAAERRQIPHSQAAKLEEHPGSTRAKTPLSLASISSPFLSEDRQENPPACPAFPPAPCHREPLETKSEMIASQRKAKLRIHIKAGNQEGRLKT